MNYGLSFQSCMAAVVQSELDALPCTDTEISQSEDAVPQSPTTIRSPRCEAFVMTGDKILNLNHHVSPSYAKVARDQLPPSTQIQDSPKRPPLSDFPSIRRSLRSRFPVSLSQPEGVCTRQISCPQCVHHPKMETSCNGDCTVLSSAEISQQQTSLDCKDKENVSADITDNEHAANVESLVPSAYYMPAFSNPQLSKRTISSDTFVISTFDSRKKSSTVTVNAINCASSLSATNSPSRRKISNTTHRVHIGSFRSDIILSPPDDELEATRLATRLFHLDGFSKAEVSNYLNEQSEFSSLVTTKYLELFAFSGLRIDAALREFLARVDLHGESSDRERLLRFFSARYHYCDPSLFRNVDEVHTLTCALLLLNSDLHGVNMGKKMAVRDFINNLGHTGVQYKRDLLKALYTSIKENEIIHTNDSVKKMTFSSPYKRLFSSQAQVLEIDPESQVEYKCGYIMRKCVYDSDGTKTPVGRRGWREWYVRLRGLVLYLGRDDSDRKRSRYEMFNNAILLHHAFAEPANDYSKKQFIFRLRTANLGEFLFQTTSAAEVDDWVLQINFVCARFSSRALPPPVCSNGTFSRTRLPKMPSSAPLMEQIKAHENAAWELCEQLARVRDDAPPLKTKGRLVEEFFFKERYLTQEILRYTTYCSVLRARLSTNGPSNSNSIVQSKSDIADDLDKMSYREAMHQLNHS